ncbi:MAG: ATP-binding cassette domain-containing protein [Neomegalonema sp.]|nr:ATP-binding cassette domain-containing protein [Neomegalonema sp.]
MRDEMEHRTALSVSITKQMPSFQLQAAFEVTGASVLFGPSGSGKTLTIRSVAGLEQPDHGRITLGPREDPRLLFDSAQKLFTPPEKRRLGVVFQEPRLFPHLTVRANLLYGRPRSLAAETLAARLMEVAELLEITPLLDRRPGRLSGGEKQRVAIGRALLSAPEALLMDEPLANLDARLKAEILPYLTRIRQEAQVPILYVTHDMTEAEAIGERLIRLDRGRVVEERGM